MKTLLKNVTLIGSGADSFPVVDGVIPALGGACFDADRVFDLGNATLFPGAVDHRKRIGVRTDKRNVF